jgi:hypothetical protein
MKAIPTKSLLIAGVNTPFREDLCHTRGLPVHALPSVACMVAASCIQER